MVALVCVHSYWRPQHFNLRVLLEIATPQHDYSAHGLFRGMTNEPLVNTRNVSQLLNAIAPCSVAEFKNAGLEYLCLQLECMLENHWIDDLDEDLLLDLDKVVRANQLNSLPFAKSGRAELELHERHPSLAGDIDQERQRRVRDMTFRVNLRDEDSRLSTSFRQRVGSLDDLLSGSPRQDKTRRKSKAARNAPFSPSIRPKDSTVDLMFDMEDDDPLSVGTPESPALKTLSGFSSQPRTGSSTPQAGWDDIDPEGILSDQPSSIPSSVPKTISGIGIHNDGETSSPAMATKAWSSPVLPSTKLDMKGIMAQASSNRTSSLSMSLSAQKVRDDTAKAEALTKLSAPKLSQKERKKQQQQALQQATGPPQGVPDKVDGKSSSPWQIAGPGRKTSLKEVLNEPKSSSLSVRAKPLDSPTPSTPRILTPRTLTPRRTASPDTRFAGQSRSNSSSNLAKTQQASAGPSQLSYQAQQARSSPSVPYPMPYTTPGTKAEPSLQLSMADIIGQQRREQEVIKEAVAKRSLHEIQEEQAFQEWWDQESKRAQEEEAAAKAKNSASGLGRGGKAGGSGGGGRGKSGRGKGRGGGEALRGGARGRGQEKGKQEG